MEEERRSPNTCSEKIPTDADTVRSTPKVSKGLQSSEIKLYFCVGFVGFVGILIATVIFLTRALCSNFWFHSVGLYLDSNRYWAVPMPNYAMVMAMVVAIGFYVVHNFMAAPPPTSLKSVFDECSEELLGITPSGDDYQLLQHLPDIDITEPGY